MSSEKDDFIVTDLLEFMALMGIPVQSKTDSAPAYVSSKMIVFFAYYNVTYITDIPSQSPDKQL